VALATPWISPYDPGRLGGGSFKAPSRAHLLGTNQIGQDLASQLLAGARTSLFVAIVAGTLTVLIGAVAGVLAGWFGGVVDTFFMRLVDVTMAIPRLPLLIIASTFVGDSLLTVSVIIAVVFWAGTARVVRAQVRPLRRSAQVKAAIGFGGGSAYVVRRHVLPEISLILMASLVGAAGRAVLFEAGLAVLGIGKSSRMSWGATINTARRTSGLFYTNIWTWWVIPPVVCLVLFLLGISFVGVAVEQRVNPRLGRHTSGRARP
jgi:ABC-type dipeptide/oligopeptide/nickel transport system permease subunit